MTLGSDKERKQAMVWFFVWQTPFIALMLVIGWASRVVFTQDGFDAELGLPTLAMEVLGPFWAGLILASIFAATMSTADSQVLACTAAVTDDIRPEWSQDHSTTKKVTLVMAMFATVISLGGLYVPGGDSVFSLVVLAVYGLGGIFVPMLIIRWAGYQPDTRHSVTMMIAALVGVIVWRLRGLNEHVFETIPGMGMAFLAHFIDHAARVKEGSPLGRFEVPSGRAIGIAALVILAPAAAAEGAYLLRDTPDAPGVAASWSIEGTLEFIEIGSARNSSRTVRPSLLRFTAMEPAGPLTGETSWASSRPWSTARTKRQAAQDARPPEPPTLHLTPSVGCFSVRSVPRALKAKTSKEARPPTTWASIGSTVPCMMPAAQRTSQRQTCGQRLTEAMQASAPPPST